jgi:hypothetical protein
MVEQGHKPQHIADTLGCTIGTLRVRCSQSGISLRRKRPIEPPPPPKAIELPLYLSLRLQPATVKALREWATARGVSECKLAATLLNVIAHDRLCDAVLDEKGEAA